MADLVNNIPAIPNGTSGQAQYVRTTELEVGSSYTIAPIPEDYFPPDGYWRIAVAGNNYSPPIYWHPSGVVADSRGSSPGPGDWSVDGSQTVSVPKTPGGSFYGPSASPTVGQAGTYYALFYHLIGINPNGEQGGESHYYNVDYSIFHIPEYQEPTYGCTDPKATNYNLYATVDDGSCYYLGCTDPKATNYNPKATVDDGSCVYPAVIHGCTDPKATNYNPKATVDDGSCVYPQPPPPPGSTLLPGTALARDVSRRTIAVKKDGGNNDQTLLFFSTQDAGHSFGGYGIAGPAAATWPCLAVSKSTAKTIVFFASKQNTQNQTPPNAQYIQSIHTLGDGESGAGWVAQTVLWPGDYPALAAQGDHLALAYQDQGSLFLRQSGDLGTTWDDAEKVIDQFDGTVGGRVALAWVGETLRLAMPGSELLVATNVPIGNAPAGWHPVGTVSDKAIQNLCMIALPGVLLLSGAEGDGSASNPLHTVLRRSVDGGQRWGVEAQAPPGVGSVLGCVPETGRLLWGTDYHSDDDGQTWAGN